MFCKTDYKPYVTSQYLVLKIAHFIELNGSYQPAKVRWPELSGSNFTRGGGKHPPDSHALKKSRYNDDAKFNNQGLQEFESCNTFL